MTSSRVRAGGRKPRHVGGSPTAPTRPFAERNGVLMTESEAGDYLGVTKRNMERMRYAGTGPIVTQIGRLIRYRVADLDAFIEKCRRTDGEGA